MIASLAQLSTHTAIIFRYQKATELFEEIGRKSINNNLLKYSVRGILLKAGICQLCRGDPVAINNSLERYQVWTVPLDCRLLLSFVKFLSITPCGRTLTQPSQGRANTSFWRYNIILTFLFFHCVPLDVYSSSHTLLAWINYTIS